MFFLELNERGHNYDFVDFASCQFFNGDDENKTVARAIVLHHPLITELGWTRLTIREMESSIEWIGRSLRNSYYYVYFFYYSRRILSIYGQHADELFHI